MSGIRWDHNRFYHRLLLRRLPERRRRVLDVGCGAGSFAVEVARLVDRVDAVDRSAVMVDIARGVVSGNVHCVLADFMDYEVADETYDAVFSICALHHMPIEEALRRMAAVLRPGGVLAVVALPRVDLPWEVPVEFLAVVGHRLFGLGFWVARLVSRGRWYQPEDSHGVMPVVRDPDLTTREVRGAAAAVLPGVRVRRLVFWRYLLTWRKPHAAM